MSVVTKNISRLIAVLAFSLLAFASSIGAASAHDQLVGSTPEAGATVQEAPEEITLEFSGVLQSLSGVDSTVVSLTLDGEKIDTEAKTKGTKVIVTPAKELGNGEYQLAYRVVSSDGHPIENKIGFSVEAPQAAPTLVSSSEPAAPSESAGSADGEPGNTPVQDLGSSMSPVIWVIIGVVILGGALGVLAKFMRQSK
ncbi:copper resistance CopC family protein [Glutamicibacter sp.]|uniref:copper resistance CopC family protein n=1 Tax=Glutamicibacter sp. TaxID=1931995 RepID=UPI003D6BB613